MRSPGLSLTSVVAVPMLNIPASNVTVQVADGSGAVNSNIKMQVGALHGQQQRDGMRMQRCPHVPASEHACKMHLNICGVTRCIHSATQPLQLAACQLASGNSAAQLARQ